MDTYNTGRLVDAFKEIAKALNRQAVAAEVQNSISQQALEITRAMQAKMNELDL